MPDVRAYDRLRRAGEIAYVRKRGIALRYETFTAYAAPANPGRVRVGVVASKSVGGAVVRNLVKRRLRGALDALGVSPGARLLFIAKPAAATVPYAVLAADVAAAVGKAVRP